MNKTLICCCLIFVAVVGMWLVDIGQIAMENHKLLTNNFWGKMNPEVVYHIGMYLNVACLFAIMIFIHKSELE
jgi:hypothetical protein